MMKQSKLISESNNAQPRPRTATGRRRWRERESSGGRTKTCKKSMCACFDDDKHASRVGFEIATLNFVTIRKGSTNLISFRYKSSKSKNEKNARKSENLNNPLAAMNKSFKSDLSNQLSADFKAVIPVLTWFTQPNKTWFRLYRV